MIKVNVICIDLKKAYYKVSHCHLSYKLYNLGLETTVDWIEQFLIGRSQTVSVDRVLSTLEVEVISGVPQGLVLGPLLFNLYLNDLVEGINSEILLYTDNAKLYKVTKTVVNAQSLQEDLDKLNSWMSNWLMEINIDKSHKLMIGKPTIHYEYRLGDLPITSCQEECNLGVVIDSNLNFQAHYNSIIGKANCFAGVLRHNFTFGNDKTLSLLYKALVQPIFEYGHCSTCPFYNKDIKALEKVQS